MRKEILFDLKSLYRSDMEIYGYRFGEGKKSLCIIGSTHGTEVQQTYVASKLVRQLQELEEEGKLAPDSEILVIPAINPYSMNIEKRYWPSDNTDIERMMPGYEDGETTQRIAHGVFESVKDYQFGVHLSSFANQGEFIPHIRMMETGFEQVDLAKHFGLSHVVLRQPKPYDTTSLSYNWQVWGTQAFLLYVNSIHSFTEENEKFANEAIRSIKNFMVTQGLLQGAYEPRPVAVCSEDDLVVVKAGVGGFYRNMVSTGDRVQKGDLLATIMDPYEGTVKKYIEAPATGVVFFRHTDPLANGSTVAFYILV